MKKKENYSTEKSRRRTLTLCFIWGILCYFITIIIDYIISLIDVYINSNEEFIIKLVLTIIFWRIGTKQIENMDLENESTLMPE